MRIDDLDRVRGDRTAAGRPYQEFLRTGSMSGGLYELPAGAEDPQRPHAQDELYYVVAGRAECECDGRRQTIGPGSVILVEAGADHRFVQITEDLSVLVVFAPAEA
jgi:mannose-6-phosphate isomerase-like protein (cupin superfamily)